CLPPGIAHPQRQEPDPTLVGLARSNARNSRRPINWTVSTNPALGVAQCVVGNRVPWSSSPTMSRSSKRSLGVGHCPGIKSNGLRSSWPSPRAGRSDNWPSGPNAIPPPSAGSAVATRAPASPLPGGRSKGRGDGPGFPPLQRAQIVQLACLEPIAKGLHITHWTSHDLARQAVEGGIVPAISDRAVRDILHRVDLQPNPTRYWRPFRIHPQFKHPSPTPPLVF